jgi:hypothetical protein
LSCLGQKARSTSRSNIPFDESRNDRFSYKSERSSYNDEDFSAFDSLNYMKQERKKVRDRIRLATQLKTDLESISVKIELLEKKQINTTNDSSKPKEEKKISEEAITTVGVPTGD